MGNIVAIVGRPNVGKSTFFNRLIGRQDAIVDEVSGVTRDRHYGKADWNGREFSIIDTGGYVMNSDDIFEEEIRKQVMLAIEECDSIIFVVDVESGLTDLDEAVAAILRKTKNKPILVAVNKVDNHDRQYEAIDFYSLGLGEVFCISSMTGSGTGEILDRLVETFKDSKEPETLDLPRFAVVGRPNAGKSSLANVLLGVDRNIVTPIAGTTRDSIFTRYNKYDHDFFLIDTAGLRKKSKVSEDLEFYSVMRAIRTIEHSDVCILLLDATRGFESQDMNIFHIIEKNRKGVVIVVNKWDLVEKETNTTKEYEAEVRRKLEPYDDVPIIFTSCVTKQRIHKILELAMRVYENRIRKIPTSKLNNILLEAIEANHPPAVKGKYVKIKYVTQLPTLAPAFVFFANLPQYIKDPYKRYLENHIRKNFDFTGVPINIFFRKK